MSVNSTNAVITNTITAAPSINNSEENTFSASKMAVVALTIVTLLAASYFTFGAAILFAGSTKISLIGFSITLAIAGAIAAPFFAYMNNMHKNTSTNGNDCAKFIGMTFGAVFIGAIATLVDTAHPENNKKLFSDITKAIFG